MPSYDSVRYDPPAPVAQVILRNAISGESISDIFLIIDTGADIPLLPRAAVERLGIRPQAGAGYELLGFDGNRSEADAVELDMIFFAKSLPRKIPAH